MARQSARRHVSWAEYQRPEFDVPRPRMAKVNDVSPRKVRQTMQESNIAVTVAPSMFESPDSSTIASAEYDRTTQVMSINFKRARGLDRYDYDRIPEELWSEFVAAESKGQFFSARIRPVYEGRKITR